MAALRIRVHDATSVGGYAVNGKMQLVNVTIAQEVVADGDAEMLADLVVAAVSAAQAQAAEAAAKMMEELTGGMDLPGLDGLLES